MFSKIFQKTSKWVGTSHFKDLILFSGFLCLFERKFRSHLKYFYVIYRMPKSIQKYSKSSPMFVTRSNFEIFMPFECFLKPSTRLLSQLEHFQVISRISKSFPNLVTIGIWKVSLPFGEVIHFSEFRCQFESDLKDFYIIRHFKGF